MGTREAKLIPKYVQLYIEDNRISIKYNIQDSFSGVDIADTWINFTPSKKLMDTFETEIEIAIKNHTK